MYFQVQIAAVVSLRRVTKRIHKKSVINFREASKTFDFDFFIKKFSKNLQIISACTKRTDLICLILKGNIHLVAQSFHWRFFVITINIVPLY
jgi:hypothetical protein